ncbi:MAG: amino acid adenylation domain-containing protein [Saprospiraceae bacterium]
MVSFAPKDHATLRTTDIEVLSEAEKSLLRQFNNTALDYPMDKTVVDLFEAQVAKYPQRTALSFHDQSLTYQALDERSNQLANYLRAQGVKEESLVMICIDRSLEMVIGILGILKAGAAYVPIDSSYPDTRMQYILEDTKTQYAVLNASGNRLEQLIEQEGKEITCIHLEKDEAAIAQQAITAPVTSLTAKNLMYIIYTSGSTGNPKGVMIEHLSGINVILDHIKMFEITEKDGVSQFTSLSFDVSVCEIFMGLLAGAKLVLVDKETINESERFLNYIETQGVTVAGLPTAYLGVLDLDRLKFLRVIMTGGEVANVERAAYCASFSKFFNVYGPTECAVCITAYEVDAQADKEAAQLPIGKPLANIQIHILDENQQVLPPFVEGEICVSGAGLARGYLFREALSAEKFLAHPTIEGGRIYRTGDRGKWLPDGNIAFLGRIDNQVKIRGHRIELGEVETILQQAPTVGQCIVIAPKDKNGSKRLVAYIVAAGDFDKSAILQFMKTKLPDYMIPTVMMELTEFPRTSNDKVDKTALPDPEETELSSQAFLAPRTETEEALVSIWMKLLDVERVGVQDNFFELGGDSIVTIQVVSRMKRLGYQLQPRDVFEHQTIESLALAITGQVNTIEAEQGRLEGLLGLLPIQQWYFGLDYANYAYFNQSLMFDAPKEIPSTHLRQAMEAIIAQHDALRLVYTQAEDGKWSQAYGEQGLAFEIEDLSTVADAAELTTSITALCEQHQSSLEIEAGKLLKVIFFKTPAFEENNRVLIAVHHLGIDGVSWRIVSDDLELALSKLAEGETIDFGQKSSSYRQWVTALEAYSTNPRITDQQAYWKETIGKYVALPVDKKAKEGKTSVMKDFETHTISLNKAMTKVLLQDVNSAYRTEINDILLSALGKTIQTWSSVGQIVVGMEGHGREELFPNLDTSNTVGWFTNAYPFALEVAGEIENSDLIKSVKEQLRAIPGKGMGYGLLRYLHPEESVRTSLEGAKWDVLFNYLGQVDSIVNSETGFKESTEDTGQGSGADFPVAVKLLVNSFIVDGKLSISWAYDKKLYYKKTIKELAKQYIATLSDLIEHCVQKETVELAAFDYGLAPEVSYRELDQFLNTVEENGALRKDLISAVYRLSPMQEGMLFHHLYDRSSSAYTEQLTFDLPEGLNVAVFKQSWKYILDHHSILRSAFFFNELNVSVQCVYKEVELPFAMVDFSNHSPAEQALKFEELVAADQQKGFDFNRAPLLRLTLVKIGADAYRMIWTNHHILMDGWSMPVLVEEMLEVYEAYLKGTEPAESPVDQFEDYIQYIQAKDKYEERAFWGNYMEGLEEPSLLPFVGNAKNRNQGGDNTQDLRLIFDEALTKKAVNFAQNNRITINTIVQGIWSLLLSKYSGKEHTTFGVTVSGRPSDLAGAESKVGLYINALPLHAETKPEKNIVKWLQEIQEGHTHAREYQYTPLNNIQQWNGIQGDFFDCLLSFENYPLGDVVEEDWSLKITNSEIKEQTNYLLTIFGGLGKELTVTFNYNADLLSKAYVELMKGHFAEVLHQIIAAEKTELSEIEIITESERLALTQGFNDTEQPYPNTASLASLFEAQVEKTPSQVALVYEGEEMTYHDLNAKANQLAHFLRQEGVKKGDFVGLCVDRSFAMIISILGIIKAGGVYQPIGADYPEERIKYLLENSAASVVICNEEHQTVFAEISKLRIVVIEAQAQTIESASENLSLDLDEDALLYVMYTSGSTGTPKGVTITHQAVARLIFNESLDFLDDKSVLYQYAPVAFDASTFEIWGALLKGGKLIVSSPEVKPLETIAEEIKANGVNILWLTAGLFHLAVDNCLDLFAELEYMLSGGDSIHLDKVETLLQAYPTLSFINGYGPTESTTFATVHRVNAVEELVPERNLIGKPIGNTKAYVLAVETTDLVPVGCTGELCLAGPGLSIGYLGDPELTNKKFIANPYDKGDFNKLYRTGDIVKWLPDGTIEYLGRKDLQVKVRGYRIELGEIEAKLQESDLVANSVVVATPDSTGTKRLIAYLIPNEQYNKDELQEHLKATLPDYMMPSMLIELEYFPLNANGKVDKKALPQPDVTALLASEYIAPRDETETQLAEIWAELLNLEKVGILDNFFEIGGHSLLATRMATQIRKEFSFEMPIKLLFEYTTIEDLAKYIRVMTTEEEENEDEEAFEFLDL